MHTHVLLFATKPTLSIRLNDPFLTSESTRYLETTLWILIVNINRKRGSRKNSIIKKFPFTFIKRITLWKREKERELPQSDSRV